MALHISNPASDNNGSKAHNAAHPQDLWQVSLAVALADAEVFAQALEPLASNVSWMIDEETATAQLQALKQGAFDLDALRLALDLAAIACDRDVPAWGHTRLPACDWLAQNQMDFPPLDMESFYIYGSHHQHNPKPLARIGLFIDAATAFGTGEHATTRGCLRALRRLRLKNRETLTILDMGCGTGILAIAAAQLWPAARVVAGDIESESVRVTRINAHRNRVQHRLNIVECNGLTTQILRESAPYDIVVANILAKPLCRMASELVKHCRLAPAGTIILSGLLRSQMRQVSSVYRILGFFVEDCYDLNGWVTLVLRRKNMPVAHAAGQDKNDRHYRSYSQKTAKPACCGILSQRGFYHHGTCC